MEGPEFQELFANLMNKLKAEGKVKSVSEHFHPTCGVEDMFSFLWGLKEANLTLTPKIMKLEKSEAKAETLRTEGNKYYQKKSLDKALSLYNMSILFAPHPRIIVSGQQENQICTTDNGEHQDCGSENQKADSIIKEENKEHRSLALGYGNRSAVLFEVQEYEKCISDIDHALLHGYPRILHSKLAERKAKCLIALQRKEEAKCLIETSLQALEELSLEEGKTKSSKRSLQVLLHNCQQLKEPDLSSGSSDAPENKNKLIFSFETPSPPQLQHHNPSMPSLSSSVDLAFSPQQGRYLVANKDIKPGDVIAVEKAYSKVVHFGNFLQTYCTDCLARCLTPLPCPGCSLVIFCSSACRTRALGSYHATECEFLWSLGSLDMGKNSVLACRIMTQTTFSQLKKLVPLYLAEAKERAPASLGFDSVGNYISSDYRTIYHLVGNKESRSVGDLFKRCAMAVVLVKLLEQSSKFFVDDAQESFTPTLGDLVLIGSILFRHMMNLPCNAHSLTEMKVNTSCYQQSVCEDIGCGAFGVLSLTNHSCNPAAARFSFGGTVVLRAVRFIPAGGEVTDSYGDHYCTSDREKRTALLQQQYYFHCACEACQHQWPNYFSLTLGCKLKCVSCYHPIDCKGGKCHKCNLDYTKVSKDEASGIVTYNWKEVAHQLEVAQTKYEDAYKNVLSGKISFEIIRKTCNFIEFIDKYIQLPCKGYFEAQETLKHCFDRQGPFCILRP